MPEAPVLAAAAAGGILALGWIATLLRFHRIGRAFPELTPEAYPEPLQDPPRISLVVAARDEEQHVAECVRSLLAQDYPDLELVFVDDRSSDRTPAILGELERELAPRLRVRRVDALPPGWGGQVHGLHVGVAASSGEWLCFTDADCRFDSPRTLRVAWQDAQSHDADLLSVIPQLDAPTPWEQTYLPLCSFVLVTALQIGDVNDPRHPAGYANGAFLLVRRAAYEQLGGHARVRQLVNDDVGLARLAKRQGLRLRVAGNEGLVRTRMYATPAAAWRGWSRNLYGTIQRPVRLAGALVRTGTLFVLPWLGLLTLGGLTLVDSSWLPAALAWAAPVLIGQLGVWRLTAACGIRPGWSLLSGLGALFVCAVLANALSRSVRRAGTTWHGVHYPHPEGV